jgi:hypothetical protein
MDKNINSNEYQRNIYPCSNFISLQANTGIVRLEVFTTVKREFMVFYWNSNLKLATTPSFNSLSTNHSLLSYFFFI